MTEPFTGWDPVLYERYKAYRDRPALDLLAQTPIDPATREIWDLGCGTGEIAAALAARFPTARVHGLDSSEDMLAKARARETGVSWILGDIRDFQPRTPPDLIFTNAALHWLPDHAALFPRLVRSLAAGGVFACQMPDSEGAVHRRIVEDLSRSKRWIAAFAGVSGVEPTAPAEQYHQWLAPHCEALDIWRTTYLHQLEGEDPVIDWISATFLRPYLAALHASDRRPFLDELRAAFDLAFPRQDDGSVLFPFPRLFIVARRLREPPRD